MCKGQNYPGTAGAYKVLPDMALEHPVRVLIKSGIVKTFDNELLFSKIKWV
jgi:hypothetical protein